MRVRFLSLLAVLCLASGPAVAQETMPGDSCNAGDENYIQKAGGPETSGVYHLLRCDGSSWQQYMTFSSSGNLGIGTTTPSGALDVNGTIRADGYIYSGHSSTTGMAFGGGNLYLKNQNLNFMTLSKSGDATIRIGTHSTIDDIWVGESGNETMQIDLNQKRVGINRTGPAATLDVAGEVKIGNSALSCAGAEEGAIRYVSTGDPPWRYCDGSAWVNFKQPRCQDDDTGECYLQSTRSNDDPDFTAANIADGVNILGVTGTLSAGFISLSLENKRSCGVYSDGAVTCWGYDFYPAPSSGVFVEISSGKKFTCGVEDDGSLTCWGENDDGEASPPTGTFTSVDAGYDHACAIKTDGTVTCWGGNDFGEASPPAGTFKALSLGGDHSCGIKGDGTVTCWGDDAYGQSSAPSGKFIVVDTGIYHNCGVKTDHSISCWGSNFLGETDPAPSGTYKDIDVGSQHNCAIKTDGTLICWGYDVDGSTSPPGGRMREIKAGGNSNCAIKTNGTLTCWGQNVEGETNPP